MYACMYLCMCVCMKYVFRTIYIVYIRHTFTLKILLYTPSLNAGFLFLSWDFKHISNNKLKIQVDPSFDAWLNDPKTVKSGGEGQPGIVYSFRNDSEVME